MSYFWAKEDEAELTRLWEQASPQLSAAEIARRLEKTKGQIIGKAHRLGLTARPSPIRGVRKAPSVRKPKVEKSVVQAPSAPKPRRSFPAGIHDAWRQFLDTDAAREVWSEVEPMPVPVPKPRPKPAAVRAVLACVPAGTTRLTPDRGCQWIDGDPRKPGWSFCNAKREGFASYCAAHLRRVWKQPTEEDQAEAA